MIYAFDVDGTLTDSRQIIDSRFQMWFTRFCKTHTCVLVTGSDIVKTREQLGDFILNSCTYSFNCNGNDIYYKGIPFSRSEWKCPDDLWTWLEHKLYTSRYKHRYGRHFDERPGMLNFSIIGREARGSERTQYFDWDKEQHEREALCSQIESQWPSVCARVGGETGIDISARGSDKSQILDHLHGESVTFFGDRCDSAGNDYPLAEALRDRTDCEVHEVCGWKETWDILKRIDELNDEKREKFRVNAL